jgi:4-oxalocrotonate tautomerase
MPFVNIKLADEGVTLEQKKQLIAGVTHVFERVLGKDPKRVFIAIDVLPTDNWGLDGVTLTELIERGD